MNAQLHSSKFLIISIIVILATLVISELIGKDTAIITGNWIYLPVTGVLIVVSFIALKLHGVTGIHGKAWMSFFIFSILWTVAENTWLYLELFEKQKPFPSIADVFYIVGYPAYFIFSILYLQPVKKSITKRMVILSIVLSALILIPNLYMAYQNNSDENQLAISLGLLYPVADSIILVPSILGVFLFLGGKVNFFWSLLLVAMIVQVAADTSFQYFSLDDSYYTGHPVDILFLSSYLLLIFGVSNHNRLFRVKPNSFFDRESLR